MVLGHGLIGTALKCVDKKDTLFCASGVSNLFGHIHSQCVREEELLRRNIPENMEKTIVYFSSYSIDDLAIEQNSPYLSHKIKMETLVKSTAEKYLIVRTSNVVGKNGQPGNLTNFIFTHLQNHTHFDVWTNTNRNLIDVEHLVLMTKYYLENYPVNKTVYLINPEDVSIESIVKVFEWVLSIKGNYSLVDKGAFYSSEKELSTQLFRVLNMLVENYTELLIRKYFTDPGLLSKS